MRYYNDPSLGVVGVDPGHTSGEFTYLTGRIPQYTWIRTDCLYATAAEAGMAEPATFLWEQPDAVTEGNELCKAIQERDELRKRVAELEAENIALGDELREREPENDRAVDRALNKSEASCLDESFTCPECGIEYCAMGLRDQVAMRALQGLLAHNGEDDSCSAVREALRYADAFLKERTK